MTTPDREALRLLALAALETSPGPWEALVDDDGYYSVMCTGDGVDSPVHCYVGTVPRSEDARLIAAANPETVLGLLAALSRLSDVAVDLRNLVRIADAACKVYGSTNGRVEPTMELLIRAVGLLKDAGVLVAQGADGVAS